MSTTTQTTAPTGPSLEDIRQMLNLIVSIIICVFGFFGNLVSIYIFLQKKFRCHSTNIYLAYASFISLGRLTTLWLHRYPVLQTQGKVPCQIVVYLMLFFVQNTGWVPMLTSLDRLIGVVVPFGFALRKKIQFQLACIFGLAVVITTYLSPIFLVYDLRTIRNTTSCGIKPSQTLVNQTLVGVFYNALVPVIIPFILMTIFTCLLKYHLISGKVKLNKSLVKEKRFVKTLIGLNIFFLLFNLPFGILHIVNMYMVTTMNTSVVVSFVTLILNFFYSGYNGFSFVVYLICNSLYRAEFLKIFCHGRLVKYIYSKTEKSTHLS